MIESSAIRHKGCHPTIDALRRVLRPTVDCGDEADFPESDGQDESSGLQCGPATERIDALRTVEDDEEGQR
jgi:hypothetical protein